MDRKLYGFLMNHECHLWLDDGRVNAFVTVPHLTIAGFAKIVNTKLTEGGIDCKLIDGGDIVVKLNKIIKRKGCTLSDFELCFHRKEWLHYIDKITKEEQDAN